MEDMTMKEQFIKWLPVLALACFVIAVFMIADGHFWNGVVFIGAGASLSSAAVIYKKKNNASDGDHKTK
jgi:thiamine transporter ThiT